MAPDSLGPPPGPRPKKVTMAAQSHQEQHQVEIERNQNEHNSVSTVKLPLDVRRVAHILDPQIPSGGPLAAYRAQASFDWRRMKLLLDGEEGVKYKHLVWSAMEKDPIFAQYPAEEMTRDEFRKKTFLRLRKLVEYNFIDEEDFIRNPMLAPVISECLGMYDWSLASKKMMSMEYFLAATRGSGSRSQIQFLDQLKQFKALGCFSMTELGHGSNTKRLKTTATFDPVQQEWVLHTPDASATKVWSGVMGQNATHAVVFAQLFAAGECQGLHSFLVPIRDTATLLPFDGLRIGDMGSKLGLQGMDNGWIIFNNYRIPRDNLMSRNATITPDGQYHVKKKQDGRKRAGANFGILSLGRVAIIGCGAWNLRKAQVVAIRYAGVRRQFGPETQVAGGSTPVEWPLLEYQTHRWRLFPYLAGGYVLTHFYMSLFRDYIDFFIRLAYGGAKSDDMAAMGQEIHALSCGGKALVGWIARDGIQEAREACGGYGYLKASGLGIMREDHDSNNTYEGDNNVILMQVTNFLHKAYNAVIENQHNQHDVESANNGNGPSMEMDIDSATGRVWSPMGSIDFINDFHRILAERSFDSLDARSNHSTTSLELWNMDRVLHAYRYLVCALLRESVGRAAAESTQDLDGNFLGKSRSQVYAGRELALAWMEYHILDRYWTRYLIAEDDSIPEDVGRPLRKLCHLFGLWLMEKRLSYLLDAGYLRAGDGQQIRSAILDSCDGLKGDAIALVDSIAPPDFVLNSCLGRADGNVYQGILEAIGADVRDGKPSTSAERVDWWREFTDNPPRVGALRPKL